MCIAKALHAGHLQAGEFPWVNTVQSSVAVQAGVLIMGLACRVLDQLARRSMEHLYLEAAGRRGVRAKGCWGLDTDMGWLPMEFGAPSVQVKVQLVQLHLV